MADIYCARPGENLGKMGQSKAFSLSRRTGFLQMLYGELSSWLSEHFSDGKIYLLKEIVFAAASRFCITVCQTNPELDRLRKSIRMFLSRAVASGLAKRCGKSRFQFLDVRLNPRRKSYGARYPR